MQAEADPKIDMIAHPDRIGVPNLRLNRPETRGDEDQHRKRQHGAPFVRGERHRGHAAAIAGRLAEIAHSAKIDGDAQQHAEAGGREAIVPAIELAQRAAHQRREEGADHHRSDVERVAVIVPPVAFGIERPDLRGEIALEQPRPGDDRAERRQESLFDRHQEVPAGEQSAAQQHGAGPSGHPVADQPADDRAEIDQRDIDAEQLRGERLARERAGHRLQPGAQPSKTPDMFDDAGLEQMPGHVEHEQRLHAVEGKALPHFGGGDIG